MDRSITFLSKLMVTPGTHALLILKRYQFYILNLFQISSVNCRNISNRRGSCYNVLVKKMGYMILVNNLLEFPGLWILNGY